MFLCATTLMFGDTSNCMHNCSVMLESICGCDKSDRKFVGNQMPAHQHRSKLHNAMTWCAPSLVSPCDWFSGSSVSSAIGV